jgi:hypothetical protein
VKGLGIEKIADLWRFAPDRMMRSYGLGKMKSLELAEALTKFLACGPDDYSLMDESGHIRTLLECVLEAIKPLPEPDQSILRMRLALDGKQAAIKDLADQCGVTAGSVRQTEKSALLSMPRAQRVGQLMRRRLAALLRHRCEPLYLDRLEEEDPWFRGLSEMPPAFEILIHYFANQRIYLWEYENRFVIARISWRDFGELKECKARLEREATEEFSRENNAGPSPYEMDYAFVPEIALDLMPLLQS